MFGHVYAGAIGVRYTLVAVFVSCAFFYFPLRHITQIVPGTLNNQSQSFTAYDYMTGMIEFWKDLALVLQKSHPDINPIEIEDGHPDDNYTSYQKVINYNAPRLERLKLSHDHHEALYKAHQIMRKEARVLSGHMPYNKNTQGIVMTTGTKLTPVLLVSLRMIRRSGITVPVEVWLGSQDEYDRMFREELLSSFNAHCRMISDVYSHAESATPLDHFQFKVFAILFSSFEDVLFLDASVFTISDPPSLFSTEPYTSHGLITWPDIWANNSSARYYSIADIAEIPVKCLISTESGQLVISKRKQAASLLMAVYYN